MTTEPVRDADPVRPSISDGVWVAYYSDWSGAAVFDQEIDALRYAVSKSMDVKFVVFGVDLKEAHR